MKRLWKIGLFFAGVFLLLCMTSCTCEQDAVLAVEKMSCQGPLCYRAGQEEYMEGCHVENDCIDCYWFPTACGTYSNAFSNGTGVGDSCMPPSCVVCGCDLTLWECYGDDWKDRGSNEEERPVVLATEGVDYRIDNISVRLDDYTAEFSNGKITMEDIRLIIELINAKEAVEMHFDVEYTALKELHSAQLSVDFSYGNLAETFSNPTPGIRLKHGNVSGNEENWKSNNIQPGKHIIDASASLNMYEVLALENISNSFVVYTYGGAQ